METAPSQFRGYACVPRDYRLDQIVVGENERVYLADLEALGTSLDKAQLVRMIGVPQERDSPIVVMYDGMRRLQAVKRGFAPKCAGRNRFKFDVLVDGEGNPAPEDVVLDYVAEVNQKRQNWSPVEIDRHYNRKIERAIRVEWESDPDMTEAQRLTKAGKIRSATIQRMSEEEHVSPRTIRYRLKLITLPQCVQEAVASGVLREQAARDFNGLDDRGAKKVLRLVAKKRKLPLADILGEEGRELLSAALPNDVTASKKKTKKKARDPGTRVMRKDVEAARRALGMPLDPNGSSDSHGGKTKKKKQSSTGTVVCERRTDDEVQAEILRLQSLAEKGSNPRARTALQALRWIMGETDDFPA